MKKSRSPFLRLFAYPGAAGFCLAAVLARLPLGMMGLGIVLALNHIYDNWTSAGLMSAVYTLCAALVTPFYARLFDRFGQRRVGLAALLIQTMAILGFAFGAMRKVPLGMLFVLAALMGLTQFAFGALVRTRWAWVLRDDRTNLLNTAYALESGLDECVFILGPILSAYLATSVSPVSQLFLPAAALLVGGLAFFSMRSTEPPAIVRMESSAARAADHSPVDDGGSVRPADSDGMQGARSALAYPGIFLLLVIFIIFNMSFSAVDVSVTALTKAMGREGAVGLQLALFALGSFCGAMIFGSVRLKGSRWRYLVVFLTLLTAGYVVFRLVMDNLVFLGLAEVLSGLCVSPIFATGNLIVRENVESRALTEGLSWLSTGGSVGTSLGSTLAGITLDRFGPHGGMTIPAIVTFCAIPLAVLGWVFSMRADNRMKTGR